VVGKVVFINPGAAVFYCPAKWCGNVF